MTAPNPKRLLKAKDILQRHYVKGELVYLPQSNSFTLENQERQEVGYCALGAIGKAHGLSDDDLQEAYGDIPLEDVIVLASTINLSEVKKLTEDIRKGIRPPMDIYEIVWRHNDHKGKEAILEKFSEACKNYNKYLPEIKKFKEAVGHDQRRREDLNYKEEKYAFAYDN